MDKKNYLLDFILVLLLIINMSILLIGCDSNNVTLNGMSLEEASKTTSIEHPKELIWEEPEVTERCGQATYYRVYFNDGVDLAWRTTQETYMYLDEMHLQEGMIYSMWVNAWNEAGEGKASNRLTIPW
jgi:hypothetical protein